jgi:uncharacterized PurR-regulated membrane protein YhhQ (DUF165 family)
MREDVPEWLQLVAFILSGYVFKMVIALLDTIPFYLGVKYLSRYLVFDPLQEFDQSV